MYSKYTGKNNLIYFLTPYTTFKNINVEIRYCVVRNSIKRFIYTYTNRIFL